MDGSNTLLNLWESEKEKCLAKLYQASDRNDARNCNSPEMVENFMKRIGPNSPLALEFSSLASSTQHLKQFIEIWLPQYVPNANASLIWGLYYLVIREVTDGVNEQRYVKPLALMREVFEQTLHLSVALEGPFLIPADHGDVCIKFASYIMNFLVDAKDFVEDTHVRGKDDEDSWRHSINFAEEQKKVVASLRNLATNVTAKNQSQSSPSRAYRGSVDSSSSGWIMPPSRRVESFSSGFITPSPRHMSLASQEIAHEVAGMSLAPPDMAKLPCSIFPKTRPKSHHDRVSEVKAIGDYFDKVYGDDGDDDEPDNRTMVLFGLGGTGKSTVALKYGTQRKKDKKLDAFLWIASETIVTIKQGVSDAALKLKLPGTELGDDDANKDAFVRWLDVTSCKCLVVFDNAEDADLIREYLPFTSTCHFLITTRNKNVRTELGHGSLEVVAWDQFEGPKFLRLLLNTKVTIGSEDEKSAEKLSIKLGGHAFALTQVAGVINKQSQTITEFLAYFNEHKHEFYQEGGNTVDAICNISFQSLDRNCAIILGVMAYLEPDNIPTSIFEPPLSADLPEELASVISRQQLLAALETLYETNLVKRDAEKKAYSLHRLVQQAFKERLHKDERQKAFNNATHLVNAAFPRHDSTNAQLYRVWEKCAICLPQVMRLQDAFHEELMLNENFRPDFNFCGMNTFCQRYLLEKYAVDELESLLETNLLAMSMFPESQEWISLMGNITSHKGQMLVKTGRMEEGLKWLQKSYHYFCIEDPRNTRECGWAADNAADGYGTANQGELAQEWHERARNHFIEWSSQEPDYQFECPSALITGSAVNKAWIGRLSEAKADLTVALNQIKLEQKDPDWGVSAWVRFAFATIAYLEKNYDVAKRDFMATQNMWLKGEKSSSHPISGACKYRLGCMALEQGELAAAINYLGEAVHIAKVKKKHMAGEYMRCIFKLSEALEQNPGGGDEAKKLRDEAEELLHERFPENDEDPGRGETYDRLVCITWR